ncbi:hypothetical protein GCM10022631_02370 [Deinococcus rubellus]|uniref:ABC transporter ATP-binding protein n=1 Tax=Deinococcus rubellus TaxID=1889240 RepID=A0ABY5YI63_9DEIO|nr:ABC transporter ATP-binding protein [Deinococcus rubellus]UWX64818.1 ABC transporter ATP-binding protein [Deinococcus rubellus]
MIETQHLEAHHRGKPALHDVRVQGGQDLTAIIGPSGAGNSTLLRAIDGLIPYSGGQILLQGQASGRPQSKQLQRQQKHVGTAYSGRMRQ